MNIRKILSISLVAVSVGGIAISALNLIPYLREEAQSASLYAELAAIHASGENSHAECMTAVPEMTILPSKTAMSGKAVESECVADTPSEAPEPTLPPVIHSGLLKLHQKNPDCVGWITIEGTAIEYPVMFHPTQKNYYLHRYFNGRHVSAGALFIAENCNPDTSDNVIIYGHHMNSGKMFAALNKYKKQSFYENHRRIVYETLNGTEIYEIICAFTTRVYTGHDFQYYALSKANSPAEFDAYVNACRSRSWYDTGKTAQYGDKLLTLSTCEYSQKNGRMVVVAKRIA